MEAQKPIAAAMDFGERTVRLVPAVTSTSRQDTGRFAVAETGFEVLQVVRNTSELEVKASRPPDTNQGGPQP